MSKEDWIKRYDLEEPQLYNKEPSPFLVSMITELKTSGPSLELGVGMGRNAIYLAQKGHDVTGIDFVSKAIQGTQDLARACSVSVQVKEQDLHFFIPPLMSFQNIVLIDVKPPMPVLKGMSRGLKLGGHLLMHAYLTSHLHDHPNSSIHLSECFKPNEALQYLGDLKLVHYSELENQKGEKKVCLLAKK